MSQFPPDPRKLLRLALLLATPLVGGGCGDDGGHLTTLQATLVSPNTAESAAVLELVGPGLRNAGSAVARTFSHGRGDTLTVVLVAHTPRTLTFTVDVPDPENPPRVEILEVANAGDRLRTDLDSYRVEFVR